MGLFGTWVLIWAELLRAEVQSSAGFSHPRGLWVAPVALRVILTQPAQKGTFRGGQFPPMAQPGAPRTRGRPGLRRMCWGGDGPLLMAGWGEDGVGKKGGCPSLREATGKAGLGHRRR